MLTDLIKRARALSQDEVDAFMMAHEMAAKLMHRTPTAVGQLAVDCIEQLRDEGNCPDAQSMDAEFLTQVEAMCDEARTRLGLPPRGA